MCCDRCNADNMKAVLVELPASADVTTTSDNIRQQAVPDRDVTTSRRLSRLGNSISRVTARIGQPQQPAQQQQQQQQQGLKDSETSAL